MVYWINNPFDNLPGEGLRALRYSLLCQALVKAGHEVVFWSSDFSHVYKRKRTLPSDYHAPEGFEVRLIPSLPYSTNICLARIRSHCAYAKTWRRLAEEAVEAGELKQPDLILTSIPPISTAKTARYFRKKWGCKIVIDIMDAWPETFYRLLPVPQSWRTPIGKWAFLPMRLATRRAYLQADAISAVGRTYLNLARKYGAKCPMHLCYHGISRLNNGAYRYTLDPSEPMRLIYVGNMGKSYDLETLIQAVQELKDAGVNLRLDLAGKGPKEHALRQLADQAPYINVFGYLNDEDLGQLLADSDIGVIPMFADSYVAVPYKLADYTAAGLPIINSLDGESRHMIDMYQAGTYYQVKSVESLKQAIMRYATRRSLIAQESTASVRIAKERFMSDLIYPEFVTFLASITGTTRS